MVAFFKCIKKPLMQIILQMDRAVSSNEFRKSQLAFNGSEIPPSMSNKDSQLHDVKFRSGISRSQVVMLGSKLS